MNLQKPVKIVSKKITRSAKGEHCTMRLPGICTGDPDTVMACHVNSIFKGVANKSHDIHIYYGCYACHMEEGGYRVSAKDILRALIETQDKLIQKGLIQIP